MKFRPNLSGAGRILRGVIAIALLAGAIFSTGIHWSIRLALLLAGIFVAFEALRGWCALRACGIKTRL